MKNIFILLFALILPSYQGLSADFWEHTNMDKEYRINCLGVDSVNTLYSGSEIGYFRSYFKGEIFYHFSFLDSIPTTKIIVDKKGKVYIFSITKLYVTTNYGEVWETISFGDINPTSICSNESNTFFLSSIGDTNTGGVFLSHKLFDDWEQMITGLPIESDSIKALDIVNKNDTIFVGLSNGLYYSTNDGEQWLSVPEFEGEQVDHFVLNSKNDLYFIVAGKNEKSGLYKNFNLIYNDVLPLSSVAVNRNDDVFVGSSINGKGVFWTSDNGTVWTEMYDGLDSSEVTALIADMDGYVYAGTNGKGIYISIKSTTGVEEYLGNELKTYPNPFSETTNIRFSLSTPGYTKLVIYNTLGYEIATLANEYLDSGNHEFSFDGSALPSGTYYFVLQAGSRVESGKLLLIN